MSKKTTYLYRMLIGNNGTADVDFYMYARNSKIAIEYCKKLYKKEKYNYYKPIKVGVSLWLRDTGKVTAEDEKKLRDSVASMSDNYSERVETPKFITKEEAGELL